MAAGKSAQGGIKNRDISDCAGIRPYKMDLTYASVSAFLADKDNEGYNSSSAEDGDTFYHTGIKSLVTYDSSLAIWKRRDDKRYMYTNFKGVPVGSTAPGAAAATTGLNCLLLDGEVHDQHQKGTQTITVPVTAATGLECAMDQTANDGVELVFGGSGTLGGSKLAFTVGTDAFYGKLKFSIATVAGTDDCAFGFRKIQTHAAAIDDYTDMAVLNSIAGDITIETILNNAATVSTDTTNNWADAETHTLGVVISAAGIATYTIDGSAPIALPGSAVTYDSGDVFVPFFYYLQNATLTASLILKEFECGLSL